MNQYAREGQANPELPVDDQLSALPQKVDRVVRALEQNKRAVARWFWKSLLAFNLVLGSVVLWTVAVPALVRLAACPRG